MTISKHGWILIGAWVFGLVGAVGLLAGCDSLPPPPDPVPTPTPTPAPTPTPPPPQTDMLLRRDGTTFVNLQGQPVPIELASSCCRPWGFPTGWAQVSIEFIDYVSPPMNAVQMRLGPYMESDDTYVQYGAAYMEVNGKADLTRFNPRFWSGHRQTVEYARSKGFYVFIDIADGWAIKHAQGVGMDWDHPWRAKNNIQGEDSITTAGSYLTETHKRWIDKTIYEFGPYDNVVWMGGNEISQAIGYRAEWSANMRARVQAHENLTGLPIHMFGTNGNDEAYRGNADFIVVHGATPRSPLYNKPTITMEYNTRPALTAEQVLSARCQAANLGSYFSLWRHSMDQAEVDKALADWGKCEEVVYCVPPGKPAWTWGPPIPPKDRKHQMKHAVDAAMVGVGDRCDHPPTQTLSLLSGWLNKNGFCASGPWGGEQGRGDALAIEAPDGLIEEWHSVFWGNGCYLNKYKNAFKYIG